MKCLLPGLQVRPIAILHPNDGQGPSDWVPAQEMVILCNGGLIRHFDKSLLN